MAGETSLGIPKRQSQGPYISFHCTGVPCNNSSFSFHQQSTIFISIAVSKKLRPCLIN